MSDLEKMLRDKERKEETEVAEKLLDLFVGGKHEHHEDGLTVKELLPFFDGWSEARLRKRLDHAVLVCRRSGERESFSKDYPTMGTGRYHKVAVYSPSSRLMLDRIRKLQIQALEGS